MSKFATKADRAFDEKLRNILAPEGYIYDMGNAWSKFGDEYEILVRHYRNFDPLRAEKLFNQYGGYLEMTGEDKPVGESREFIFTPTSNGGAHTVSIDVLIAEGKKNIEDLGDDLMQAFKDSFHKDF